jgi:hypothetical protein
MRLARPDSQRGTTSPALRGRDKPPQTTDQEIDGLLTELHQDDADSDAKRDRAKKKAATKP